ncbi:DUF1990 family protein [Acidicapsa acidisoli]|uniref:DUF1990 family protein n=1 Tax=Acidicapsa acidisoli TaxID=1615681 RepID=UPI0021E083B8|nr:DUF1990 domain-containing protein [Acidicapsa acidisoli]
MFSLLRPKQSSIYSLLEQARNLPVSYGIALNTQRGTEEHPIPEGYVRDHTRTTIGRGAAAFDAAKEAFRLWQQFDLGWVRVANPEAKIEQEEVIAVEAHSLGLWSVNFSRILYIIDEPNHEPVRFGFGYGTTPLHVERGEERFLLEFYPASGEVCYDLLAFSQPSNWLARLGYPYTRSRQHKFAQDSHHRMRQIASAAS